VSARRTPACHADRRPAEDTMLQPLSARTRMPAETVIMSPPSGAQCNVAASIPSGIRMRC
jgi:hypothetical protein